MSRSLFIGVGFIVAFALMFELASFTAFKINDISNGNRLYGDIMDRSGLYQKIDLDKLQEETKTFH